MVSSIQGPSTRRAIGTSHSPAIGLPRRPIAETTRTPCPPTGGSCVLGWAGPTPWRQFIAALRGQNQVTGWVTAQGCCAFPLGGLLFHAGFISPAAGVFARLAQPGPAPRPALPNVCTPPPSLCRLARPGMLRQGAGHSRPQFWRRMPRGTVPSAAPGPNRPCVLYPIHPWFGHSQHQKESVVQTCRVTWLVPAFIMQPL